MAHAAIFAKRGNKNYASTQEKENTMKKNNIRTVPDVYPFENPRAIDGDTLEVKIILSFQTSVTKRIRLKGWWASELTGPWAEEGRAAQRRLQLFMDNNVCWLLAPVIRTDKYGRVLADLWKDGKIVSPNDVLGPMQLTSAEHKQRKDQGVSMVSLGKAPQNSSWGEIQGTDDYAPRG